MSGISSTRPPGTGGGGAAAPAVSDLKKTAWVPTGFTDESLIRVNSSNTALAAFTTGTMRIAGNLFVPAGKTVNAIGVQINAASTAITNFWAALIRATDGLILAKSADNGAAAVPSGLFTFAGVSWLAGADTPLQVGIVPVGTGLPTFFGTTASGALMALPPAIGGNANTGLTDPASLVGPNIAAIVAANPVPWVGINYV